MANQRIVNYVQKSLEGGYSIEQITTALVEQGWNSPEIHEAYLQALENIQQKKAAQAALPPPPKKSEWSLEIRHLSVSQVLLFLGGLVVVLAGITFIGTNWSQWGYVGRILAILLPMLICYGAGAPMFFSREHKKEGAVFLFIGSLLFPIFLTVTFLELKIFTEEIEDQLYLAVSLLSVVLYLASSFIFRFPIWAFLYHVFGIFMYYSFLKVIGVGDSYKELTMSWFLLIPGTLYIFMSLLYEKFQHAEEGRYSHLIGNWVVVFSLLRLFREVLFEHYSDNSKFIIFVLLVLGMGYFGIGILMEKLKYIKYSRFPYLIGTTVVFVSLARIPWIPEMDLFDVYDYAGLKQFPNILEVVIGFLFLLISFLIKNLKIYQLEKAAKFSLLFNWVGPYWVLQALRELGSHGSQPVYETLLLLASLGFIFGSIPMKVRQYLYIGTIFLIIYIFGIGAEYFQDQMGWPMTLFVAGLASMGVGVLMEKFRRKYFTVKRV